MWPQNPPGLVQMTSGGYERIYLPGHPVADASGHVRVHRAVLYAKLGPGEHACHWCGQLLQWDASGPLPRIETDHLNWFPADNRPDNVVASCTPCNRKRKNPYR
jgi:hypothetical protein